MNAPAAATRLASPAAIVNRAIRLIEELWRDGRSVAGIQLELEHELGLQATARRIMQRIKQRRRVDPTVPPPLYTRADYLRAIKEGAPLDVLDQRADLTEQWAEETAARLVGYAEAKQDADRQRRGEV